MADKASIKSAFIQSSIFETTEEVKNNPFTFSVDNLTQHPPSEVPNILNKGYLLRISVSTTTTLNTFLSNQIFISAISVI